MLCFFVEVTELKQYLILCRSVTSAQRCARLLQSSLIRASVTKAPSGLTKAGELLMAPVRESYNSHALKMYQNKPKFLISGLDDANAAVLGAAALGWEIKQ